MKFQVWVGLAASLFVTGCLSSGVRSTGATLPQTNDEFDDGELKVTVKHDCSGERCKGFSAKFENLTDNPLEIIPSSSKISRAGESYPLSRNAEEKGNVVVPPKEKVSANFFPVSPTNSQPLTYVRVKEVWCSLKVDSQCKDPSRGEAMCGGFARYYQESYVSAGGWTSLEFTYKNPWKTSKLTTVPPNFMGDPPPVTLTQNSKAPFWWSGSDEVVFHKVECNDKCVCTDVTKRRNFFTDDKFLPAEK